MKLTKISLSIIVLGTITLHAFSQNTHLDFKYAAKVSNLATVTNHRNSSVYGNGRDQQTYNLFNPVLRFLQQTKKGNFNEIELHTLQLKGLNASPPPIGNGQQYPTKQFRIALKASHYFTFFKQADAKWVPMLGVQLMPSMGTTRYSIQVNPLRLPLRRQDYDLTAYLSPRVMWFPSKKFFVDFSTNIYLMQGSFIHTKRINPSAPKEGGSQFEIDALKQYYTLQVGLGLKL